MLVMWIHDAEATPCLEVITFFVLCFPAGGLVLALGAWVGEVVEVVVRNSAQEASLAASSGCSPSHTTRSRPHGEYRDWILASSWK